ncbi:hypothetical protein BAUCODRAFT_36170 [Baudoinia panamericana UAMH 10762]|uniref:Beach-domain-containing protein n=1 Tax=Baudoinia panamericana (strain UAMH 10762) TaxID=717646 RepID=M2MQF9_BAUPA|nr:uncharacterized protein BAUCODRAFT_36170 [Baudoinia panamericana UAMH 10762]EMC93723.1 hypothetical protein BAUCODRAFT_36170 [Baudoinia panamericana UAMH 10762]
MSSQDSQNGYKERSTSSAHAFDATESDSTTALLLKDLVALSGSPSQSDLNRLAETADKLRVTLEEGPNVQSIFRHGRGFERVLDVLSKLSSSGNDAEKLDRDSLLPLVRALVVLLAPALRDHRGNVKYFAVHLDGWTSLQRSLERFQINAGVGSRRSEAAIVLYEGLLQLATNDTSYRLPELAEIQGATIGSIEHAQAAHIVVYLALTLPRDDGIVTARAIAACNRLIRGSLRNKASFWKTTAPSDVLRATLGQDVGDEVRSAAHDLTLNLADFGLGTLDDVAYLFRQGRTSDRAREILLTVLKQSTGPSCVQFDLSRYGYTSIELPSLPRTFPPTSGYTLSAWMRIDEYDAECHTTLFGAFDTTQACFILVYLERDSHQLILQTSVRSSRPSVRFKSTRFTPGRWYHLALVHRKAADPRQSPAMLFVDGDFAEQVKCGYPDSPPELEDKHATGSPARSGGRRSPSIQAFFGTPHDLASRIGRNEVHTKWSLGSAYLHASPLTDEYVAVQYRLGPRYAGNMQDCLGPLLTYRASAELHRYNELLHPDKIDKSDILLAVEGRGSDVISESRLLISINPSAVIEFDEVNASTKRLEATLDRKASAKYQQFSQTTKAIIVNAAVPTLNDAICRPYGVGVLTGDPVVALPRCLDDATWCLAGSLPLVISLLEHANTKRAFLQSVQIFFECVQDNWRISEAMEKGSGYGLFALIIREKLGLETGFAVTATARQPAQMLDFEDRQSMPIELLELILEFVGYNRIKPEDSMIVNPMAYRVLLVDFDTWRRCDIQTQKLYYQQFVHFTCQNKHQGFNAKRLVRMRVVRRLAEALKAEEIASEAVPPLMQALKALLDNSSAGAYYKDLAMFVAFGLHDARATSTLKAGRSMASIVNLRQRAVSWARQVRTPRTNTPGGLQTLGPNAGLARSELAVHVLQLLADILCDDRSSIAMKRFQKAVPNRWLLHLLAETDVRVVEITLRIACHALATLGADFKTAFVDKNGGFVTMKFRLKTHWRSPQVWIGAFAMLLGQKAPSTFETSTITAFSLMEALAVGSDTVVVHHETLPALMSMLETGLRSVVKEAQFTEAGTAVLNAVIRFLSELYTRSPGFRQFAIDSRYIQDLLFVLFPVLVGSDRLAAATELEAEKDTLSFGGEEVRMRPHSNSLSERPPSVRSLTMEEDKRTPSPISVKRMPGPKRLSSFIMVNPNINRHAHFNPALAPKQAHPVKIDVGNDIVESLLEVAVGLFIDLIVNREKFHGIGLFLKVPPGFREHQAYFESYIIVNTLSQLWNTLKLNQWLLLESRVLTNLARYSQHLAEAVFEGWFIDGAQPVLDFTGQLLDYLQQPGIAQHKNIRLCSQYVSNIRVVFLRVTLWRLSELDENLDEQEAVVFLNKINYWQTILFSTEERESRFVRLICFLLYLKLVATPTAVRVAAARLWRTILVQKPVESATLLADAMGAEHRHLCTGFMKLASEDEEDWISWVDDNKAALDTAFVGALSKEWTDFVDRENKTNEDTAKGRLSKRQEKLRLWQTEEAELDEFVHRYEISTSYWRSNAHAQERLKLQRAAQDHQEMVNQLGAVFSRLASLMRQPVGLEPDTSAPRWQLDETEALHRMRLRITRDKKDIAANAAQPKRKASARQPTLQINTQLAPLTSDNVLSPFLDSPTPTNANGTHEVPELSSSAPLLEGAFEMVDDPKEDDDGTVEDKNRKIMTSLQRGDMVQQLYNISRIIGLEACEGLLVVGKTCLYLQDHYFQRSDGEIVSASQAPEDERDPYVQLISGKDIGTQQAKHNNGDSETRHWTWAEVLSISKRRFLFRDVSVEVFFTDGRSYLITCMSPKVRDDLHAAITARAPHVHNVSSVASEDAWRLDTLRNPEEGPQSLGTRFATVFSNTPSLVATKRWMKGEMSNFQYLMLVNTMAGRTFNDLTQYPVFPWVLADYTSDELDLDNPKTFRDLSKPMGCQTQAREADYRDRYKQFAEMADQNAPPFHYGTHYSSAMIVSSYLIRLQPFVASYLLLQGGSFDHADRLFDSVGKAWLSASRETMSDVRELTPEFYCLPEFLTNVNGYDFGVKQGGGAAVNDVQLPPWAKGDPHVFIAKHREALECPHVSANLHKWIDLVFGYKQRGEAAVEATNVFNHLSYQGAKDLDTINDPVERLAAIGIIHSFGQTPHQVFQRPHTARETSKSSVARLDTLAESLIRLPETLFQSDERVASLTFSPSLGRLLCAGPYRLDLLGKSERFLQLGFADNSLRFLSSNTKRLLGLYENTHVGPVTTAAFADSKTLVTGGADCTIGVWSVRVTPDLIEIQPRTYLFGHRAPLALMAASRVFSTLLSVSADGQVVLWGLNRLNCIRAIATAGSVRVQAAVISNVTGHIALCQGAYVSVYTLNGHLLLSQKVCDAADDEMLCCAFYEGAGNEWHERELLLTGHSHGVANVWALTILSDGGWHLQLVKRLNHVETGRETGANQVAAITAILPMPTAVYTGDEMGRVYEWDCIQRQSSISVRGR